MLDPVRVDAAVDVGYGLLILVAIVLIATLEFGIGIAFALGVFSAYLLHVTWKMARFDPDWMTSAVQETVEETVEQQIEPVQEQLETVDERIARRPREDQVEELIGETLDRESAPEK